MTVDLMLGNCLNELAWLDDNSIDSVVTDPPYGLSFMGKKWDYDVPSVEIWKEVFRVLKPGGHLLSFGGTRTYHRMVVNIEDAGFEIRDQIQWVYGSGFPKSHNIKDGDFKGWGTALKPANEPICMARKPIEKGLTVAANVLRWGTGGINVDGCRIAHNEECRMMAPSQANISNPSEKCRQAGRREAVLELKPQGRWPANIIFDESAAGMLDAQSGILKQGVAGNNSRPFGDGKIFGTAKEFKPNNSTTYQCDNPSGASRFFYVAKASKSERNKGCEVNGHPTVKPIKLMEYLCKLVTPPNGTVLDPFMGSGSTGVAAKNLGFNFVGCEMNEEYFGIAKKRIK